MTGDKRRGIVETDPKNPPSEDKPDAVRAPRALPASGPPVIGAPPPLAAATVAPPAQEPNRNPDSARKAVAIVLSLCLGLFLADAVLSFADESLNLLFDNHVLSVFRGIVFLVALLMTIVTYVLIGLTPMVPKRWFLPITLFGPVTALVLLPLSTLYYGWAPRIVWGVSICQVLVGMIVLHSVRDGWSIRWPLVSADQLGGRCFSWQNLAIFLGVNILVAPPAVIVYLGVCAALAVNHFTDGFMALSPRGLTVQARKYVRNDGRTIELFPMAHVADAGFYQKVSASFPTNSVVLMEGVTDEKHLLTNKISYKRMAQALGLSEQHEQFAPSRGETVRADVDVDQFAPSTINLLNVAMLIHSKGLNAETILALIQYPQPPNFEVQLFDDLVRKRNEHLLGEINRRFSDTENIVVPWGALHMPTIARDLQLEGFRQTETHDYVVVRFGPHRRDGSDGKAN
jgi:hypothetical protein